MITDRRTFFGFVMSLFVCPITEKKTLKQWTVPKLWVTSMMLVYTLHTLFFPRFAAVFVVWQIFR